jgi:hypothetical protein
MQIGPTQMALAGAGATCITQLAATTATVNAAARDPFIVDPPPLDAVPSDRGYCSTAHQAEQSPSWANGVGRA